jgi:hypothetical protein
MALSATSRLESMSTVDEKEFLLLEKEQFDHALLYRRKMPACSNSPQGFPHQKHHIPGNDFNPVSSILSG